MPTYEYRCGSCLDEQDFEFDMGTAPRLVPCDECGGRMQQVIGAGVNIAPSALESKGAGVRALESKDDALGADLTAYKRMRLRGLQPQKIDGAHLIENEMGDNFDVTYKDRLTKAAPDEPYESTKQRVREGMQEIRENPQSTEWLKKAASE
jgi:putative FmdB family regulatory protein